MIRHVDIENDCPHFMATGQNETYTLYNKLKAGGKFCKGHCQYFKATNNGLLGMKYIICEAPKENKR